MRDIEVEYAVRDGASIAFTVFGSGPIDVVIDNPSFPIDLMWDLPQLAEFMESLGEVARVIAFDVRGHGASDAFSTVDPAAGFENTIDDTLAVLDAAGSERAAPFSLQGGHNSLMLAATHPERARSSRREVRALRIRVSVTTRFCNDGGVARTAY